MKLPGHDAMARQDDEKVVVRQVKLPKRVVERPLRQVAGRLLMALTVLVATAIIVWVDRSGYNDNSDGSVSLRAHANNDIVTADNAGASPLIANRTSIGTWESFDLIYD